MKQQGFSDRDGMKGRKTCGIGKAGELLSFIEEAQLKKRERGMWGWGAVFYTEEQRLLIPEQAALWSD